MLWRPPLAPASPAFARGSPFSIRVPTERWLCACQFRPLGVFDVSDARGHSAKAVWGVGPWPGTAWSVRLVECRRQVPPWGLADLCVYTRAHTHRHTCTHTCSHTCTATHVHKHAHTHTHTCAHMHAPAQPDTHTNTCTHMHDTHMQLHVHTHTCTHPHRHTRTHPHFPGEADTQPDSRAAPFYCCGTRLRYGSAWPSRPVRSASPHGRASPWWWHRSCRRWRGRDRVPRPSVLRGIPRSVVSLRVAPAVSSANGDITDSFNISPGPGVA